MLVCPAACAPPPSPPRPSQHPFSPNQKNTDINAQLASYAGPGGWNDPCLLLAEENSGALRMTQLQTRAQFNLWAIMASPLLISANVRNMSAANLATYSNAEVC